MCRYDVLLAANQPPRTYYITSNTQYRAGAPNGYGLLRYNSSATDLPPTATPQPGVVKPWNETVTSLVRTDGPFPNSV